MASAYALRSHDTLPPYDGHMKVEEHRRKGLRDTVKQPFRKLRKTIHEKSASFHKADHKSADNFTTNITEIKPPPTYDDCMKEVEKLTQEAATNTELQQKIEEVAHQTGSQDNLKAIHEGVDQFTSNITRINSAFDNIRAKLYAVDRLELTTRKGDIWKGVPKWIGLRNEWRSLLEESQDTARKSVTRCDDFLLFCEGVLKIESVDDQLYKDTIKELEHFTKTPDPAGRNYNPVDVGKQATAHSRAFHDLKEKLTDFKNDFDDFAEYQETRNDPVIKDLNKQIQVIERGISFDIGMIMSLGVALKVLTGFTALAGGVIAAVLGPVHVGAIITLVTQTLTAIGEAGLAHFIDDQSKNEEQRDKLQNELNGKETLKQALEAAKSKLEDPNDGLGFIFSQVDLLKNVWHTISHEAHLIANRLTAAMDKQTLTYLKADIQAAKESYKELRQVLARYSSAT